MKQVFISYQHDDEDFADILIQKVKEAGYSTWIDNDQLQAGTDWREGIDHAIKASCALIVIMSPAAKASEYVTYEWAFAWGAGVKVIPIVYKQTPLHPRLETLHYLNFTSHTAHPWERLLESLKKVAQTPATIPQPQAPLPSNVSQTTPEQWSQTGDIFSELHEYDNALEAYEEALQHDPNNARILKKKGDTLTELKQYRDALICYKISVRLQPNFIEAYIAQCEPLEKLEQFKDALAICEQALHLDPNNADVYTRKGMALSSLNRNEEALAAYERALHLDPNNIDAWLGKLLVLTTLNRN